jgi:ABC-type transporter Mla subunit MlaD
MKQKANETIYMGFLIILLLSLVFLSFSMVSCKSLEKERGYENYKVNTDWKTRKL